MTYIVQQGDTLYSIAQRYGVTICALISANNLYDDSLFVGQSLFIPVLPVGTFSVGSRGAAVAQLQRVLSNMGYDLDVDGIYGPVTADIIYSIQKKYPELVPDSIYGPHTRYFLQNMINNGYKIVKGPDDIRVLVNKTNALLPSYYPTDLVVPSIPFSTPYFEEKKFLRHPTAIAIERLFSAARLSNVSLTAISGFRPYYRQAEIFLRNWQQDADEANRTSARAGESEHQTGLALDVSSPSVDNQLIEEFGDTDEGRWLAQNAPLFGFIIRYPKSKEDITGYSYEPWHLRYIGYPLSVLVTNSGLTYEEYLNTTEC